MNAHTVKTVYYSATAAFAVAGATIARFLGGWDTALQVLIGFMVVDYLTGVLCALIWKKSPKSENGAFESKASIKGLFRKVGILACVYIGYMLDNLAGTNAVRTAVILFFVANDGMSIVENLGIMGLPMPAALKNAFELLRQKSGETDTTE